MTDAAARRRVRSVAVGLAKQYEDDWERGDIGVYRCPALDEADFWGITPPKNREVRFYQIGDADPAVELQLIRLGIARWEKGDYTGMMYFSSPDAVAAHDEWEANG